MFSMGFKLREHAGWSKWVMLFSLKKIHRCIIPLKLYEKTQPNLTQPNPTQPWLNSTQLLNSKHQLGLRPSTFYTHRYTHTNKFSLFSLQASGGSSPSGRTCLQSQLATSHLLPVRCDLWRPADTGWLSSLPAITRLWSRDAGPQSEQELCQDQRLRTTVTLHGNHH